MALFDLQDFKKQASIFFREKLNDARLVLTDVSRMQLLTEEATNEDPWDPETRTMAMLADAAFELEEFEKIVYVIHQRLDGLGKKPWRQLYRTLCVLEYLIIHGPKSVGREFMTDAFWVEELCRSNLIDQQGMDRALIIQRKAEKVLELLINPDFRTKKRDQARKISIAMQGLGSSQKAGQNVEMLCNSNEHWDVPSSFSGFIDQSRNKGVSECEPQAVSHEKRSLITLPIEGERCMFLVNNVNFSEMPPGSLPTRPNRKPLSSPGCIRESSSTLRRQADIDISSNANTCFLDAMQETDFAAFDEEGHGGLGCNFEDVQSLFKGADRHAQVDFSNQTSRCSMAMQSAVPKFRAKSQQQWQPARAMDWDLKFGKAA